MVGTLNLNVSKLMKLSDKEFKELMIGESKNYIEFHQEESMKSTIRCVGCEGEIDSPENLIRYFGLNLHPFCFLDMYSEERDNLKEREKRYFDRIADLFVDKSL